MTQGTFAAMNFTPPTPLISTYCNVSYIYIVYIYYLCLFVYLLPTRIPSSLVFFKLNVDYGNNQVACAFVLEDHPPLQFDA